jgi:polyisoprenoid-binding protein YceI
MADNKNFLIQVFRSKAQQSFLSVVPERVTWNVNNYHSNTRFLVNHSFGKIKGRFELYDGSIIVDKDMNLANADIHFTILTRSLRTGIRRRDRRLLTRSFLNAAQFPVIDFKSLSIERHSRDRYFMEGSCIVKGVTKLVSFEVIYEGMKKDELGNRLLFFKASGKINRRDFGFRWNRFLNLFIKDEIDIQLNIECM